MVHWGGQGRRGRLRPGTRDQAPDEASHSRAVTLWLPLALVCGLALAAPATAAAQAAIGFQGGFAVDPEQVFGGVFFQSGDLGAGIRLRPGIDGARGEGLRIATINADLVYGFPLGNNGWTFLAGGGPSIVITRIPDIDFRDTGVGFHSLVGFGHDRGFFAEVRLGSGRAQQLKVGVGWAITLN